MKTSNARRSGQPKNAHPRRSIPSLAAMPQAAVTARPPAANEHSNGHGDGLTFAFADFAALRQAVSRVAREGLATEVFGLEGALARFVAGAQGAEEAGHGAVAARRALAGGTPSALGVQCSSHPFLHLHQKERGGGLGVVLGMGAPG